MRRALLRGLLVTALSIAGAVSEVAAGGPRAVNGQSQPMHWNLGQPVFYHPESGPLGLLDNTAARALLAQAFAVWEAGPASITFIEGAPLGVDVNAAGFAFSNPNHYQNFYRVDGDGKSPIIFDHDGSIIDALFGVGAHFDILGVAGIDNPIAGNPRITGASIIINGTFYDGVSLPASPDDVTLEGLKAAMVHEIGHFINLDHSWLNHELALDGNAGNDIYVPSMFPIAVTDEAALATTNPDDERAAQSLYPAGFGQTISGSVSFAGIPFQGANVVLRKSGDPLMTAYSIISGRLFFPCNPASTCDPCTTICDPGNPPEQGAYAADFLPAGNYSVCVEQIDTRIAEENGTFIGPLATPAILPGPEECFDLAEGGTSADDPDDAQFLAAGGGPVDLVLNALPATDPFEPNDTLVTGATLADLAGTGIDAAPGVLGAGDLDVFNVPVIAGQRVRIDLDAAEMGSGLDAVVGFYNAANTLVAISDDATDPDSHAFSQDPALDLIANFTGTAKVVVSSFPDLDLNGIGGGSTGGYWLRVEVTSDADGDGVPDGEDICPTTARDDPDRDGVCFGVDNCPTVANPSQDVPYKVNAALVGGGDVSFFAIAPGDARIVYVADQQTNDVFELYSVPTGGGTPVRLNPVFAGGPVKNVTDFRISPDGSTVVYLADQNTDDVFELFAVPIGGGVATQLNAALVLGGDVLEFGISPDGARVVYRADQTVNDVDELWSVPIGGGTVTRLNDTFVAGGSMVDPGPGFSSYLFSANGSTVVYAADQDTLGQIELYRVAVTGGGTTKLNPALIAAGDVTNFQVDAINARVLFLADAAIDQRFELYTVPLTGGAATTISGTMPPGSAGIANFRITADGATAVYRADQDTLGKIELYSVPAAGGTIVKLNGTLTTGGNVTRFQLPIGPGDGNRLDYRADQVTDEVFELFSVPIAGGSVVKLSPTPVTGGDIGAVGDIYASTAIYAGDIETDNKNEVYTVSLLGGTVTKLSGTMVTGGNFSSLSYTTTKVAIRMDKDTDDVFELYGTQLQGGQPFKLNGPLVSGGDVGSFGFTESLNPGTLVYIADQDVDEQFELYARPFRIDRDADGVLDDCDLCPLVADASQADVDGNGAGDACQSCAAGTDPDVDNICTAADNCPTVANPGQADFDADGAGDACDADDDNDGLDDASETALGTNPLDSDSDNDGVSDGDEVAGGTDPNSPASASPGVPFHAGRTITSTANGAYSVFVADVDGDGDVDALSASIFDDKIAWYENNGASPPVWTPRTISTAADGAQSVFAVDVDGDGDVDVLSASQNDDKIAWYENNGASPPVWTPHTIGTAADAAQSVFAADVDGDGDVDALSASLNDDTIAWYENDGASPPVWTPHTISTAADGARSVFAADVDGDGDVDVLSASQNDDKIAWYENNGASPPVWTPHTIGTVADGANSVFAADLDGDGDVDALSASFNDDKIAWYENNGASPPVWTPHTISTAADGAQSVFAADVDGDGDVDALSVSLFDDKIAWYENDGASPPVWTPRTISTAADGASSVFAADVDGDGDLDALSASQNDDKVAWYENETIHRNAAFGTRNTISGAVGGAVSVDAGDIDGDGDIDTIHGDGQGDTIRWFESDGANPPSWTSHTIGSTPTTLWEAHLWDLDSDGDLDVLYATGTVDNIGWVENGGGASPSWTFHTISTTQDQPIFVTAADIDGDGDLDVVAASQLDSTLAWYRNDGGVPLAFTKFVISTAPQYERGLATADMDRDGDIDIVAAVPNLGRVVWFENGGGPTPTWTEAIVSVPSIGVNNFVDIADINGDGDLDVVSASYNGNDVAWFESDGAADPHWTTHSIVTPFTQWSPVSAKDMDGDGDIDIVASGGAIGFVWLDNDGNDPPAWTIRTIPTSGDSVYAFTPADIDADGDLDLVVGAFTQANGHEHEWWENRGGQFSLVTTLPGGAPSSLADGSQTALLAIELTSNGRSGDSPVELATLQLSVTDSVGTTLSSDEANRLIERLRVYLDTGSEIFERGIDPLVTTVETLQLSPQVIRFASGDPRVRVAPGQTARFFVVAELTRDASARSPNSFRLVHLAQSGSSARDAVTGAILRAESVPNAGTGTITILPDAVPPFVTSVFPPNHAVDVSPATRVLLYFSEPVDPSSVAAGVTLYKGGVKVPSAVLVNGTAVTIDPEAPLALASDYVVQVTSLLRDRDGNAAVPFVAAFGTTAQPGFGTINASAVGDSGGGATLGGSNADDNSGFAAAALGDVNGTVASHGIADLIIGAPNSDAGATDAGKATLVFGAPGLQANGSAAASLTYRTGTAQDFIGETVARAGDMNGDSVQDFLIGAPRSDQAFADAGAVYLVFGNAGLDELAPATLDLDDLAACSVPTLCGVRFLGAAGGDLAGGSISFAGDVNGDGHDDIIIGAPGASPGGKAQAGRAYLVYGPLGAGAISLSQVGSTVPGLVLNGESAGDGFGAVVSSWRDGGGDGFDDLLIGAPGATALDAHGLMLANAGYVYALQGGGGPGRLDDTATPGVIEMSRVANGGPNQVAGMVFIGDRANGRIGRSVTGAVDIDGNGTKDVVIAGNGIAFSIPGDDPKVRVGTTQTSGTDAGGGLRAGTFAASRDLGAVLYSTGNDNPLTVGAGGDLNGDGFDDFIIGDPLADTPAGTDAGRAYVVLGLPTLRGVDLDLSDVGDTIDGFIVEGAEPGDNLGASVGGGADLNADGVDDGLVGAPFADADPGTPANAGETYVLSPLSPDEILGLNLTNVGGGVTRLEWSRPDLAASYNVYREALSALRLALMVTTSGMAHLACGIATDADLDLLPDFDDATTPPAGDAWVYLVTGVNLRGEGPLGPSGASPPRINDQQCP